MTEPHSEIMVDGEFVKREVITEIPAEFDTSSLLFDKLLKMLNKAWPLDDGVVEFKIEDREIVAYHKTLLNEAALSSFENYARGWIGCYQHLSK